MAQQNTWTASYLIASARRRGQIPDSSDRSFSFDDLVDLMSEENQTYMVPLLMSTREEWFVRSYDQTVTTSTAYRIPPRSIGSDLRQVLVGSGLITDPNSNQWTVLRRIEPIDQYLNYYGTSWWPGSVQGYYLQHTDLRLMANPPTGSTLRMMYFLRPNRIVPLDQCGTITAIDTNLNQVTLDPDTLPAGDGIFTTGDTYDLVRGQPGFESLAIDQTITAITGADLNVYTFSDDLPDGLAVGDFMCFAGTAPVAQIPVDCIPLLTQRLVVAVLDALGDPKMPSAKAMLDEKRKDILGILDPRTQGDARYVTNRNGPGWGKRFWSW